MTGLEQVFCEVCSRGVLISREPVYKCRQCGKVVCRDCFHSPLRQCEDCYVASLEEQRRIRVVEDEEDQRLLQEQKQTRIALRKQQTLRQQRVSAIRWLVIAPVICTLFCWLVLGVLLRTPHGFWLTLAIVHDFIFIMTGFARYPWREDLIDRRSGSGGSST